jgi:predicted outer membrane protein
MTHSTIRRTTLLAATFAIGLAGCDRQEGSASQQSTTSLPTELPQGGVLAPASPTATEITTRDAPATIAADVASLKAPAQAAVLRAIDQRVVDQARLAERTSRTPAIQRVAHELVRLHHDEMSTQQAIFTRMHVWPVASPASREIEGDEEGGLQAMRGLRGHAFDSEFLDEEIRTHAEGVEVIDRMFPGLKGSELQAEVLRSRTGLTAYLATLTDMQKSPGVAEMQGSGGSTATPPR